MARRVVGIGHASVDLLGVVDRYPARDSKIELAEYSQQGGGTVATALCAAASLGAPATFVGKLGDDDLGRFVLEGLRAFDIDTERAVIVRGGHSPLSFVVVDRETASRTILYTRGDLLPLEPPEVDLAVLEDAQVLLIDGMQPRAQIAAAEAAQGRGVTVLYDAGSLREGSGELLALSDIVIASERFLTEIAPRGEPEDSLAELRRLGPHTAIVTLGVAGSVGLTGQTIVREEAHDVEPVDTTGAGDVYHGAYAAALLQGLPLERAMRFASVAAGLSCLALGGRAAIPELGEVLAACGWNEK
jgi:ribokinase